MTRTAERKEYPLSMRLPEADIAIIDRAAGRRGRSRTDFIREAAVRAAEGRADGEYADPYEFARIQKFPASDRRSG